MILKISHHSAHLMNAMLREDTRLPMVQAGLISAPNVARPWTAGSKEERSQYVSLRRWFEEKVCKGVREEKVDEKTKKKKREITLTFPDPGEYVEVPLINSYIKLLRKIYDYYKPIGMMPTYAEMFEDLDFCIEGKDYEEHLDSPDDLCAEPVKMVEKADNETEAKAKTA